MKANGIIFGIVILIFISSCGVPQSDYEKLQAENKKLKVELEDCQYGADKLIAKVEKAYSEKKYPLAKQNIELLYEKHPESPKNKYFKTLLKTIEKEELAEKKRKEAEEKDKLIAKVEKAYSEKERAWVSGLHS